MTTPTAPATDSTPTATAAGPTASTQPADCLNGTYALERFVGAGDKGTFGTGSGGDVTVQFDNGAYELVGRAKKPIEVTLAGQRATLLVNGTAKGDYQIDGDQATFRLGDTSGKATLTAAGRTESLTMGDVANVIAPSGTAKVACTGSDLTLTLDLVRLEFSRA